MSKKVIENLLKAGITRQHMTANGFSIQKYDDILRGKSNYNLKDLTKISELFQLSLDYLVYGREKSLSPELSEDKLRLLEMYDNLTEREQGEILGELKIMTRDRIIQKNGEIA